MKKIFLFIFSSILLLGVTSCKQSNAEQELAQLRDSLNNAKAEQQKLYDDSIKKVQEEQRQQAIADSIAEAKKQEAEKAASTISKGVYQVVASTPLFRGPSENFGVINTNGDAAWQTSVNLGEYVEATGRCKDGFALVRDHLYYDMSQSCWGEYEAWVPIKCLKRVRKCNHTHDMADGLI